ncbi:MAG: thiamine pyrophosphate-dependent dehydrogenase E1 component subunit alpha, partial [Pseudomonadales bacterium]|nr:thiamine pyrophosphate-dependent dehydrogenase E1 component subunit alpha [Pseudomonadales bacterium]
GQDVFAIAEVALAAIERARTGRGPTFIEAKTLRFTEHDVGTQDLGGWTPRTEEEHAEMRKREPVKLATDRLLAEKVLDQGQIDEIVREAEAEVADTEAFADAAEIARPSEEELLAAVFAK